MQGVVWESGPGVDEHDDDEVRQVRHAAGERPPAERRRPQTEGEGGAHEGEGIYRFCYYL